MKELLLQDALLEIGTEEIPAGYFPPALSYIKSFCENFLKEKRLSSQNIRAIGTPRRIALILTGLPLKSESQEEEIWGPSLQASKDSQNQWTQAAKGFAQSHHIPLSELQIRSNKKGEYLCIIKKHEGIKSEKIIAELFLNLVPSIPFPKKMVWNETQFKFARPIRNLIALFGSKVLPLSIAGVKSSNKSFGISHLTTKNIAITSVQNYLTALRNHCVLVDAEIRKKAIVESSSHLAKKIKAQIKSDENLMDEIVWMVEHPVAILGSFDSDFLSLPQEILITCMKKHQKFFSLLDSNDKLMPCFIAIRNGISEHQETVRKGYEKVLKARLSDAQFFLHEDLKKPLEGYVTKSNSIFLQGKLGTIGDKIERMKKNARFLVEILINNSNGLDILQIERAIHLCKFDLSTSMVYEFPELQGIVGEIYAAHYGEKPVVSRAIREHYYPLTNQGELPQTIESSIVSLSEKIESLVGNFLIGVVPSGNSDPYGLRRHSTGILRIILENKWDIDLRELTQFVAKQFHNFQNVQKDEGLTEASHQAKIVKEVSAFLTDRFQLLMQDAGFALDEIYSVTKNSDDTDLQKLNVLNLKYKIDAVHSIRNHPDFEAIATAFKRTCNILKQAKGKSILSSQETFNPTLLQQPEEIELHSVMNRIVQQTQSLLANKNFQESLQEWVTIRKVLDQFFDKVLVMDNDAAICANRLSLLSILENNFKKIADFSFIQNRV